MALEDSISGDMKAKKCKMLDCILHECQEPKWVSKVKTIGYSVASAAGSIDGLGLPSCICTSTTFLFKRGREKEQEQVMFTMVSPPLKRQKLDVKEDYEDSSPFDMLSNEILEIPIKMALKSMKTQEQYTFLVDVLPKVSTRIREIANHKSMWKDLSPFERLPDNLAEIPIRMAMSGIHPFKKTDLLLDDLAKVSTRFKALAGLKSLWKGHVAICGPQHMKQVIHQYVNDGTTNATIVTARRAPTPATLSANDISTLAARCPKMSRLCLISTLAARCPKMSRLCLGGLKLEIWPYFTSPWTSLKKLILIQNRSELVALGRHISANMFVNVELHQSLPNLEEFNVRANCKLELPDMGRCKVLHTVGLGQGQYLIAGLPPGLKHLSAYKRCLHDHNPIIVNTERESLEAQFEACEIADGIQFETRN